MDIKGYVQIKPFWAPKCFSGYEIIDHRCQDCPFRYECYEEKKFNDDIIYER